MANNKSKSGIIDLIDDRSPPKISNPKTKVFVQQTLFGKRLRIDQEQQWTKDGKPIPQTTGPEKAEALTPNSEGSLVQTTLAGDRIRPDQEQQWTKEGKAKPKTKGPKKAEAPVSNSAGNLAQTTLIGDRIRPGQEQQMGEGRCSH